MQRIVKDEFSTIIPYLNILSFSQIYSILFKMYKKVTASGASTRGSNAANTNIRDYCKRDSAGTPGRGSAARSASQNRSREPERTGPQLGATDAKRYGSRPTNPVSEHRPAGNRPGGGKRRKRPFRLKTGAGATLLFGAAVLLLITAIIILVQSVSCPAKSIISEDFMLQDDMILPKNVRISEVPVGELTVGEARVKVTAQLQPKLSSIAFTLQNEHIDSVLRAADLGASYDVDAALREALVQNKRNASYDAALAVDDEILLASITALNGDIPNHAENASFVIGTDEKGKSAFVYTEGHSGMMLDLEGIVDEIYAVLQQGTLVHRMSPDVQVSQPTVTEAMLREKTTLLASYKTEYQFKRTSSMTDAEFENHQGRDFNITKAIGMMNVITLEQGQIFSFNNTTGKREEKSGWALANAVYKGGFSKEYGGGVCQITTTMFNALLRANIRIVERKGHTIPSTYVTKRFEDGLGFDATVDYGSKDFRFQNDTDSTLYVFCYVEVNPDSTRRKLIHIEVYGQAFEPGVTYKVRNEILEHVVADKPEEKLDKNQPIGFEEITRTARDYYKVQTFVMFSQFENYNSFSLFSFQ